MIKATRLSTIRFVRETASILQPSLGITLNYVDWDDHADISKLPAGDLYGLLGLGITDEDRTHAIAFTVSLSTQNDPNLFRMTDMTDLFYRRMRAGSQFKLYDPANGGEVGVITLERGTTATPVNRVETRAVVSISATGLLVPSAEFAENN